jgi:phosphoglycerate dehydrogenase-like enzyme
VLVAANVVHGLTEYLGQHRPRITFRGVPLAEIEPDDLAWAEVFVGFRHPATPSWGAVQWIHSIGAGVDGLLAGGPIPPAVTLTRSPEDFGPAIGEWCVARALAVNQHLQRHATDQAARRWNHGLDPRLLRGQRVLIVGTGLVGSGIARAFRALGASVHGLSRSGRAAADFESVRPVAEFDSAIGHTDWLILAAPSTTETRRWLDRGRLERCGGAGLMNVGRGAVVDENALIEALDRKWIGSAALDVFEREPLDPASPLWRHPQVTISPHVSGPSTLAATADGFLECLAAFERGDRPRWIVDPERGY